MTTWTALTDPGGTTYAFAFDPFSPRFVGTGTAMRAWCATNGGLYYNTNILSGSWTLRDALDGTHTWHILRPSTREPGVVYISYALNSGGVTVGCSIHRFTNYGASRAWTVTDGDASFQYNRGMDIDQYGADECLVNTVTGTGGASNKILRILSGVKTVIHTESYFNDGIYIQKPLRTFAGAENRNVGGSECLLISSTGGGLRKTSNGGASWTAITPSVNWNGSIRPRVSVCFTQNANVMCAVDDAGNMHVSTDGGASWTYRGQDSALHSLSCGFWPVMVDGNYRLYFGGGSKCGYSNDFGLTKVESIGNWTSAVGAAGPFIAVLPVTVA